MLVADGHRSLLTHIRKAKPLVATISSVYSDHGLFFTAQANDFAKENRYPVASGMPFQELLSCFFIIIPPMVYIFSRCKCEILRHIIQTHSRFCVCNRCFAAICCLYSPMCDEWYSQNH